MVAPHRQDRLAVARRELLEEGRTSAQRGQRLGGRNVTLSALKSVSLLAMVGGYERIAALDRVAKQVAHKIVFGVRKPLDLGTPRLSWKKRLHPVESSYQSGST